MAELELTKLDGSDDSCGDSTSVDSDNEAVEDAGGGLLVINEERDDSDDSEAIDISVWLALHNGDLEEVKKWINSLPKKQQPEIINKHTINGDKALHIACLNNQLEIAKILLEAGADPNVRNLSEHTALHCACSNDDEESIEELVKTLFASKCKFDAKDEEGCTPLHYAAENGHATTVALLLNRGAQMKAIDGDGNTPVHRAAAEGHVGTLTVMIAHMPECVHWEGETLDTPLHVSAAYGHIKAAEKLINSGANLKAINAQCETPLHQCVSTSDPRFARLLLDAGADPNAKDCDNRSPLYGACLFGNTDVVALLMKRGAIVDMKCLEEAVTEGYERMATELLKCDKWPELLRQTIGNNSTPFREMIKKMPDVAEEILNRCTVADPNISDHGDAGYEVVFNYEFIEDFRDSKNDVFIEEVDFGRKKKQSEEKKTYGVSYSELTKRQRKQFFTTWGPVGFKKTNHPLAIMVQNGRLKLLTHPLVRSLLHYKWNMFGQIGYFFNLFTYCVFLAFLTIFALLVPNPQTPECVVITGVGNNDTTVTTGSEISCANSPVVQIVIYVCAGIVIFFALCRLLLEFSQLVVHRLSYITDWVNWMEIALFLCSIIFVWIFNTQCQCPYNWQWQIGAVAIFLAWLSLIIFFAKFPLTGIYVLMFVKIFYTFLKMVTLSVLLVIAFALTFYMAFHEPSITRSPFSHPGRSILKTMTMTTGEFDFDSIFRQDPTGQGDMLAEIPFPPISYVLWIIFIVLMPILLTNMLVGLAVGDIQAIQDEAVVRKLALQVEQVLTTEELLPRRLRRRFITGYKSVFPNRHVSALKRFRFAIWGGEHYDSHASLKRALQHKKPDQVEDTHAYNAVVTCDRSKEGGGKEAIKKTMGALKQTQPTDSVMSTLLEEISEMKKTMSEMDLLIRELAKNQGITVATHATLNNEQN